MGKNKVLLVDDDPDDLQLIQEVLIGISTAFQIKEAHNGEEALEELKQSQLTGDLPCLIVMDINMPIMDGKKTLEIIKTTKELKDVPLVVFTTSNSVKDRSFCQQFGVEMVTKPTSFASLQAVIKRFLVYCNSKN